MMCITKFITNPVSQDYMIFYILQAILYKKCHIVHNIQYIAVFYIYH